MKIKFRLNGDIIKIIISAVLFVISLFFKEYKTIYLILLVCSYLIVSFEIFVDDFKDGFAYIEISTDITYKDENVYVVALNLKEYAQFISGCFENERAMP